MVHVPKKGHWLFCVQLLHRSVVQDRAKIDCGFTGKSGFDTLSVPRTTTITHESCVIVRFWMLADSSRKLPFTGTVLFVGVITKFGVAVQFFLLLPRKLTGVFTHDGVLLKKTSMRSYSAHVGLWMSMCTVAEPSVAGTSSGSARSWLATAPPSPSTLTRTIGPPVQTFRPAFTASARSSGSSNAGSSVTEASMFRGPPACTIAAECVSELHTMPFRCSGFAESKRFSMLM